MYKAASAAGFAGRHWQGGGCTGSGAHPASTRIRSREKRMWVVYLEVCLAFALAVLIVWWTWPKKRDGRESGKDGQ
jgi:hypothetical protein